MRRQTSGRIVSRATSVGRSTASVLNILDRNFKAEHPNQKWLAGSRSQPKKVGSTDTFSRKIVGCPTHKRSVVAQDALNDGHCAAQTGRRQRPFKGSVANQSLISHERSWTLLRQRDAGELLRYLKVECARNKYATINEARLELFRYRSLVQSPSPAFRTALSQSDGVRTV